MQGIPEPELMDDPAQAEAYAAGLAGLAVDVMSDHHLAVHGVLED